MFTKVLAAFVIVPEAVGLWSYSMMFSKRRSLKNTRRT